MKINKFLPLFILFTVGCTPKPTFNVNITGEHMSYKKVVEKSTLGTAYQVYIYPDKGYEIIEDEEMIQITNKFFDTPILREGIWSYSQSDSLLTIYGSIINCDTNVKIVPDYKVYYLNINLTGENYETKSVSKYQVTLEHPDYEINIKANDGFITSSQITTLPADLDYTYTKNGDSYDLKIKKSNFFQDITVTIGEAIPKV